MAIMSEKGMKQIRKASLKQGERQDKLLQQQSTTVIIEKR